MQSVITDIFFSPSATLIVESRRLLHRGCGFNFFFLLKTLPKCDPYLNQGRLAIRFLQDTSSSNELIGYVELTEFGQIWPES